MMTSDEVSASSDGTQWQSIKWKAVEQQVLKLQVCSAVNQKKGWWVTLYTLVEAWAVCSES